MMNNIELTNKFYKEILQIKKRFEDIGVNPKTILTAEFVQIVTDMKELLSNKEFLDIVDQLQEDIKIVELAEQLRGIYNQYYFYLEKRAAENIVLNKTKDLFLSNNCRLGDEEAKYVGLNKGSKVFYIGSGPFPWSAINYATKNGCGVTCIDSDPTAVYVSKELIKSLGLTNFINVSGSLAQEIDYSQATHVVIAGMALPKSAILKQISKTSRKNAKIIARSSIDLYFFMYQRINKDELKDFKVMQTIGDRPSELVSYILSKR